MSPTYTISELAKEFDVTTRTIRFYEDEGLLRPERRGQTRVYSSRDRVLLKLILRGKRLGFSLAECRELFDLYDPEHDNQAQYQLMLDKLGARRAALDQQLRDIKLMQLELDAAETRIRDAMTGNPQKEHCDEDLT
ncbi:MAG: MerR family DNA-binding transcriptional regulator [Moraxellaceae bacterium]|nr:MerR family DNA-binding transcriptional regulator [Moraxellaceae bacterium]